MPSSLEDMGLRPIRAALIGLAAYACTDQPVPQPTVPSIQLTYDAELFKLRL